MANSITFLAGYASGVTFIAIEESALFYAKTSFGNRYKMYRSTVMPDPNDLPRERLIRNGPAQLSDQELIAVLLGSGTKEQSVFSLAEKVVRSIDERNSSLNFHDLSSIVGIGSAKATSILAALEFARRRIRPKGVKIKEPADVYNLVRHYVNKQQEHFICVTLNGAHEVIQTRVVTIGLLNKTQIHPREVFADALMDRAAAVIVAHNHPSGEVAPSSADIEVTRQLLNAGAILGINLLDHLIFSEDKFCSLQQLNKL